ncbi:16S rRNA (cytosine(1402)-N(4))-methyltransferase RsmH [Patescibacteria group bacterium]|nr:16S rRNA (cytosine(1402)-N(4))-methyltransferase RsmH [Patescibacteria group bacterium]MBU4511907.1 16S rRNA (cytosine(1402)-N(4))-methyltransferase RsmH [Patescibacteria group bacterium]MCG2692875.1 16S rRNA (cytosine(1402)-N(4))-methyltransferase RsmH [Candidatus Parcubacteria bacterium]
MPNIKYCHIPVLLEPVIEYLNPRPGQNFVDCTAGGGGHAIEIAKRVGPDGRILGLDLDPGAIAAVEANAKAQGLNNVIFVNNTYRNLIKIIHAQFSHPINGILFDLGLSSAQLQDRTRGFSFQADGELSMNYDGLSIKGPTAAGIINNRSEEELIKIFKEYGEEPRARRIAGEIVRQRKIQPITTTLQLVKTIKSVVGQRQDKKTKKPCSLKGQGISRTRINSIRGNPYTISVQGKHPATRVFQALRIAVNNELENLKQTLPQALEVLEPGGRLVLISYHSLEDRIVKNFFRQESRDCLCPPSFPECRCGHKAQVKIITKKPVVSTDAEVKANPRSRSAKMRVGEKI